MTAKKKQLIVLLIVWAVVTVQVLAAESDIYTSALDDYWVPFLHFVIGLILVLFIGGIFFWWFGKKES